MHGDTRTVEKAADVAPFLRAMSWARARARAQALRILVTCQALVLVSSQQPRSTGTLPALLAELTTMAVRRAPPRPHHRHGGLLMGNSNEVPQELETLLNISSNATTVCEIGFNAGHGAAALLAGNPKAHLYEFDNWKQAHSPTCMVRRAGAEWANTACRAVHPLRPPTPYGRPSSWPSLAPLGSR